MLTARDRVKGLRRVRAGDLLANPKNWRTHPTPQREVLSSLLGEVGYAGALLARETDEGLVLIDGHLRADLTPDQKVPVLVLDVTEEEADRLLASYDPIGAMAGADSAKLQALLESVNLPPGLTDSLLTTVEFPPLPPADPANDPAAEWKGMPDLDGDVRAKRVLTVYFASDEDVATFAALVGAAVDGATKYLWFPNPPA